MCVFVIWAFGGWRGVPPLKSDAVLMPLLPIGWPVLPFAFDCCEGAPDTKKPS